MPRPFTLDRDFIQEIRDLVPAEPLDEILADYDTWRNEKPRELCRKVVIELLAWQFASPVRWIETQDLLFIEEAAGGLGIERFVEIGVKSAPTVAGLATNTLKLPEYSHNTTEVLNSERDAAVLFATDTDPEPDDERRATTPAARRRGRGRSGRGRRTGRHRPPPAAPAGGPRPDDIGFDAADATMALIALSAKMRIDQIEPLDSIESITDGASSRRNQLLVDLGSELNLGAIDGAAEADLAGLKATGHQAGPHLQAFRPSAFRRDQRSAAHGARPVRQAAGLHRRAGQEDLGARRRLGQARHRRGGAGHPRGLQRPRRRPRRAARRCAGRRRDRRQGHRRRRRGGGARARVSRCRCRRPAAARAAWWTPPRWASSPNRSPAATACWPRRPGWSSASSASTTPVTAPETATDAELIDLVTAELGSDWPRLVAPAFDGRKAVLFDDRWASAREDLAKLWLIDEGEIDADWPRLSERFEGAGHVVGTQATWWQGKALAAGRNVHASLYGRAAAGAENPGKGRYTDEVAVVTGASKGSIAASVVGPVARRRCDGHRDHVQARRRPAGVLPHPVPRQRPLRRDSCGWCPPTWRPTPTSTRWSQWVGNEQTESLGPQSIHLKDAQTPTLLFPFAAPRVAGDLSDAGSRSEMEMKVLLWAVQRLIGGLSHIGADRDIASRLHVVLPGSPNRGMFGGDGAYGESKSALDAVVTRWKAESSWAQRVSLAHALIGWTKGTGLMGHNDAIVGAVEEAGVTTYTTDEMASDAARAVRHRVQGRGGARAAARST